MLQMLKFIREFEKGVHVEELWLPMPCFVYPLGTWNLGFVVRELLQGEHVIVEVGDHQLG
jgi:hypothetical protein